jgi:hypothetical protein
MYKWRFKAWGLAKNLKTHEASKIVQDAVAGKQAGLPVIRGRQIGARRLKTYLSRMAVNLETAPLASGFANPSLPRQLTPPDSARLSEGSLLAVIQFAKSRMQTDCFGLSSMYHYDWDGDAGFDFWQEIRYATDSLANQQDPAANFRLLDKAFGSYVCALDVAKPSLVWVSILAVLLLAQAGAPLADSFIRFASSLSKIKLGQGHPVTRLWSMVCVMSHDQIRQASMAILSAYFTTLESDVRPGEEFRRVSLVHVMRTLARVGAVSPETVSDTFQPIIEDFRTTKDQDLHKSWYLWARWSYCQLLFDTNRHEDAGEALIPLGWDMHAGHPDFTYDKIPQEAPAVLYYTLAAHNLEALGRVEEATLYYIGAYTVAKLLMGPNYKYRLATTSSDLKAHYHRRGDTESAQKIEEEAKASWDALLAHDTGTKIKKLKTEPSD